MKQLIWKTILSYKKSSYGNYTEILAINGGYDIILKSDLSWGLLVHLKDDWLWWSSLFPRLTQSTEPLFNWAAVSSFIALTEYDICKCSEQR